METILLEIADFFGDFAAAIRKAISEENFVDQLFLSGVIITAFAAVVGGIRLLVKWFRKDDEKLREEVRDANAEVKQARKEIADVRKRNEELRGYDPNSFMEDMKTVEREKVFGKLRATPEQWLEPLRPAMSVAYASLAREMLLEEPDRATLTRARHAAWGAVAARPVKENLDLLASIEEAWEADIMDAMPEHERAAWKLSRTRHDPAALIRAGESLIRKGKYKVAKLLLSRAIELAEMSEGPTGAQTLSARYWHAHAWGFMGHYVQAETEFRDIYAIRRRDDVLGENHPHTLSTRHAIAQQMASQGRYGDAEKEFRDIYAIERRDDVLGENHPDHLRMRYWLAKTLDPQGKHEEASRFLDGLRDAMLVHFVEGHTWVRELDGYLASRNVRVEEGSLHSRAR